jgi:hypothetical protein
VSQRYLNANACDQGIHSRGRRTRMDTRWSGA